mmetsp:Transcript_22070/g.28562  ORF Transcript_22070/g.28562 Transcript_22070/m.28562 type:complete len:175 (-) Transcript_22070:15-539(-)
MGPSDEEKKALIIRLTRNYLARICSQAGTQDPLTFVHPNADGTGSWTEIWESEAAAVKTGLLVAIDNDTLTAASASRLTYEQQKHFVLDNEAKSWHHEGVTYTINKKEVGPTATVKAVLTFPTYQQLLEVMYTSVNRVQEQEQQQTPLTLPATDQTITRWCTALVNAFRLFFYY